MPTKTEISKLTKEQLVDFACDFFEDTGNLRQQMEALSSPQIRKLLLEHDADEEPESKVSPVPEVTPSVAKGPLDLGSW